MPGQNPVFLYSSEFYPFKGGVGRYSQDMAELLSAGGFAAVTVFTETPDSSPSRDAAFPFRVIRAPLTLFARHPWLNLGLNVLASLRVLAAARKIRPAWFIATGKRSIFNTVFIHGWLGGKLAIVLHGSELTDIEQAKGWRRKMLRAAFFRACKSAQRIIISNRYAIARFQALQLCHPSRIAFLYPIIDQDRVRFSAPAREAHRQRYFQAPAFSLVTLARLSPRKGQDMAIRALAKFAREASPDFRYFIIGNGAYQAELERRIAAENLVGKVHILTNLGDEDAYALVSLCDMFVMPNREAGGTVEGFGISFLEANLLGVPALAGKSGGSTEAVEEGSNGLVCDGDDPDDVYRKIRRFYEDAALRTRLKAGCREHALERFSSARWRGAYQAAFR